MSSEDHVAHSAEPTNEAGDGVSTVVLVSMSVILLVTSLTPS